MGINRGVIADPMCSFDFANDYADTMEWILCTKTAKILELRKAVFDHWSQRADDLCWMDDNVLYGAFGLPFRDNTVGCPEAMLRNCERFIRLRCEGGGEWKSYAELEAYVAELEAELIMRIHHNG